MISVRRRLGVNLLWNTVNTWGGTALTVASSVAFARLLQPERWGIYSTFTWLVATFALLINLGWNLAINKLVAEAVGRGDPRRGAQVFQSVLAIEVVSGLGLGAVAVALRSQVAAALGRPEVADALPLILLGVAAMVVYTTCNITLIALQRYRPMSVAVLVTSGLALLAGVAWLHAGGGTRGLLLITAGANLASAVVSFLLIARRLPVAAPLRLDRPVLVAIGQYALTAAPVLVLGQIVFERAEVFFLSRSQPAEQVGYYSLAFAMTTMAVNVVPNVVIGPLLAMAAELHGRQDTEGLRQLYDSATGLLALVAPPVGIGGALMAGPAIRLLYGPQYTPVAVAAGLMLPAAALLIIPKPATSLIWGLNKQSLILKALVPGAVLNLALDAAVIPRYGLYGAVLASTTAQVATIAYITWVCLGYLRFTFPWSMVLRTTLAALLTVPFGLLPTLWLDGVALLVVQALLVAVGYSIGLVLLRTLEPAHVVWLLRRQHLLPRPLRWPFAVLLNMVPTRAGA